MSHADWKTSYILTLYKDGNVIKTYNDINRRESDAEKNSFQLKDYITGNEGGYGTYKYTIQALSNNSTYYADVSANLGAEAEELTASVQNIGEVMNTITQAQKELDQAVQAVNENLQTITGTSEQVSVETEQVLASIEAMQGTMKGFRV